MYWNQTSYIDCKNITTEFVSPLLTYTDRPWIYTWSRARPIHAGTFHTQQCVRFKYGDNFKKAMDTNCLEFLTYNSGAADMLFMGNSLWYTGEQQHPPAPWNAANVAFYIV